MIFRQFGPLVAFSLAALLQAQTISIAQRDKAIRDIQTCLSHNDSSHRDCIGTRQNLALLTDVYRQGDKSVLATLLEYASPTDFYEDALQTDPEYFLETVGRMPEPKQKEVAFEMAGSMFGLRDKERFTSLRTALANISLDSPIKGTAQLFLDTLTLENASFSIQFFPANTFTSSSEVLEVHWYSREMYALHEQPLWPLASTGITTFRLNIFGSFGRTETATLEVQRDGTGRLTYALVSDDHLTTEPSDSVAVGNESVSMLLGRLDQAYFWDAPTEEPPSEIKRALRDGAGWVLEGVQNGKYHFICRHSPDFAPGNAEDKYFSETGRLLLELAAEKQVPRLR